MTGIRRTKTPTAPAVVVALAGGATIDEAAMVGGLSTRTINRRLAEPAFKAEVLAAREALFERSIGLLAAQAAAAINVLVEVMNDPTAAAAARVSAARVVLEHPLRAREQGELAVRIAELEATFRARAAGASLAGDLG